jgi:hypothetical protein
VWIVLEGIDGTGKTTTARWLESHRGWRYGHAGPPGRGGSFPELISCWWRCENRELARAEHWAWDRGHLGELFCGPVRRGTTLVPAARNAFEAFLLDRDAEIWWLDPPADRVESEFPLAQRASERMHLMEAARESRVRVRRFVSAAAAAAYAQEMPTPARLEVLDPAGVGTRAPRWWVLGEQASGAAPCALPFLTASGLDMLWPGVDPTRVRVSNALMPDADLAAARTGHFDEVTLENLAGWWKLLREPQVLTLGGTAEAACRSADVPVAATMRHPQYIRRFYHHEVPAWAAEFREKVR